MEIWSAVLHNMYGTQQWWNITLDKTLNEHWKHSIGCLWTPDQRVKGNWTKVSDLWNLKEDHPQTGFQSPLIYDRLLSYDRISVFGHVMTTEPSPWQLRQLMKTVGCHWRLRKWLVGGHWVKITLSNSSHEALMLDMLLKANKTKKILIVLSGDGLCLNNVCKEILLFVCETQNVHSSLRLCQRAVPLSLWWYFKL